MKKIHWHNGVAWCTACITDLRDVATENVSTDWRDTTCMKCINAHRHPLYRWQDPVRTLGRINDRKAELQARIDARQAS